MSEMALPPALAGLLGGAPDAGLPPDVPAAPAPGDQGGSTVDILRDMIDLAKSYIEAEDDEEDKHTMAKVLTTLQKYLADEQRESDDAMQGKASPKLLRQTYGA